MEKQPMCKQRLKPDDYAKKAPFGAFDYQDCYSSASTMSISINGKTIEITDLTSSNSYIIDSEIMDVLSADETTILTANSSGPFPVLEVGDNVIGGSGWSSLRIERRERFL